ncbi:hypothetical protein [Roseovarius sp. E0-M6]|uniref:hypothetical protein n=1 Tax=Roseovarius sp. E0-M6 TaxID=3127118 RepID=UPI00300FA1A5
MADAKTRSPLCPRPPARNARLAGPHLAPGGQAQYGHGTGPSTGHDGPARTIAQDDEDALTEPRNKTGLTTAAHG